MSWHTLAQISTQPKFAAGSTATTTLGMWLFTHASQIFGAAVMIAGGAATFLSLYNSWRNTRRRRVIEAREDAEWARREKCPQCGTGTRDDDP